MKDNCIERYVSRTRRKVKYILDEIGFGAWVVSVHLSALLRCQDHVRTAIFLSLPLLLVFAASPRRLVAEYLCRNYLGTSNVKFVLAARCSKRLEDLKADLCSKNAIKVSAISTAVADTGDYESLLSLAKR